MLATLFVALTTWMELMQSGNAALDKSHLSEAASHFQSALKIAAADHERAAALNNLATVEETRGNLSRAERLYVECIETWTRAENATFDALAKPLNNLAVLYRRRAEYKKAAELYQRSLALRPNSPTVLNNLGRMALVQRNYPEAEEYFRRALAITPEDAATLSNLAELQFATRRIDDAKQTASRVLRMESDRPLEVIARLTLAAVARDEKRWTEADAHLKRAAELSGRMLGEQHPLTACVYAEYAQVARKLKRKGEAADYEERARVAVVASAERHTVSWSELLDSYR